MIRIVIHASLLFMTDGSVKPHDPGNNTVYFFRGLSLTGFYVFRSINFRHDIARHPAKHRIAAVYDLALKKELVQLLHTGAHILKSHTYGDHGKSVTFKISDQLRCIPAVYPDFFDIELRLQFINGPSYKVVVHDIPFSYIK